MKRLAIISVAFSLIAAGIASTVHADGLIKKLPPTGHWSTYEVVTSITHEDGTRTDSTGILIVRALGQIKIDNKTCRWLEFEFNWEQEPTKKVPPRFHSSVQKIAIDESVFANNSDPIKGILAGFGANRSAHEKPEKWSYQRPHVLRPGLGSMSGFGALDHYLRLPFDHSVKLGTKMIDVGDSTVECIGIESDDTSHKISTAYRQWACNDADFGVVKYQFEELGMDGTSFSQELTLKESGENAESSLPDQK